MAKRGRKKNAAKTTTTDPQNNVDEDRHRAFSNQEVDRRVAAVRAIQAAETESLLLRLRLLRSYFDEEQLKAPILEFFHQNMPNISLVENEKYKWVYELKWNDKENGGFARGESNQFSVKSATKNLFEAANLQIPPDFALEDAETQMMGMKDAFQTPGVTGNRLSFGMTPKSLRVPKNGEVLLSVRGSPLGVYKEESLEAIHESGDGSHEGASQ
ncbi:uncharacterized protein M6B38_149170 [Iris pallida]|uniref:Uncharacterized protein n=1 Tax=Iris pallida TaxID=29817 RepID=A0AAX6F7U3_IRIPA|nr:uncharacterized protein M6B38_149170 [Iris pallida]